LNLSEIQLQKYSDRADSYYIPNKPEIKPNGKLRQTYIVKPALKKIQNRILHQIFLKVEYPRYLQGSIKDKNHPRDYLTNCAFHTSSRVVTTLDIESFFDSISYQKVYKMWKYFFKFPDEVATVLTKLTTYRGFVAQGATTSSYIANLIFWEFEPQVKEQLGERGFTYTRYVDDITVSSKTFTTSKDNYDITTSTYRMFFKCGVRPNRAKRKVTTNSKVMQVHKVNINSKNPTLPKKERKLIKALVWHCEQRAATERETEDYRKFFDSVSGKVGKLKRLHPKLGSNLQERLQAIRPILTLAA